MTCQTNGTPVLPDGQDRRDPVKTDAAIRAFAAACLRLLRCSGGLNSARASMAAAAGSDDWSLEGGRFTADGQRLNWPLSAALAEILEERERARGDLHESVRMLLACELNPMQWARVAGEFWEVRE